MKARTNTKTNENRTIDPIVVSSFRVEHVRETKSGTPFADITLNGVTIYGCAIKANRDGDAFIAWPSEKGADGKWYKKVWAPLSEEDSDNIITAIYKALDNA